MRYSEKIYGGADTIPRWAAVAIILFIGVLLNLPVVEIRFLYDDISLIITNPFIREARGFFDFLAAGRPVRTLTFFIDHRIWGYNPRGFHITNLVLHLGAAVIWFRFLDRWFVGRWTAFGAALLFVVHPAGAEALAVVSNRKEMLAFIFLAASLWSYLGASRPDLWDDDDEKVFPRPKWRFYSISWLFFLLGLGSKQVVVILPVLAFVLDVLISGAAPRRVLRSRAGLYLPYLVIPALFVVFSFGDWRVFGYMPAKELFGEFHLKVLAVSGWSITAYLRMLAWPVFFSADHQVSSPSAFEVVIGIILWFGMMAGAWVMRRRRLAMALGLAWTAFNLLVVLNLVPANQPLADRYLYIPMAGFCLFLAGVISSSGIWKSPLRVMVVSAGLFFVTLAALNYGWDYIYHETMPMTASVVLACLVFVMVEAGAMRLSAKFAGARPLWRGVMPAGLVIATIGVLLSGINTFRSLAEHKIPWAAPGLVFWLVLTGWLWVLFRRKGKRGGDSRFFRLVIFSAATMVLAIWIGTVATYRIEQGHWKVPVIFSPEKAERLGGRLMEKMGRIPLLPENTALRVGHRILLTFFIGITLGLAASSLVNSKWTEGNDARRGYVSCLVLLVLCFGWLNVKRLSQWETSRTIWEATLRTDPASERGLVNLGVYWKKHGRPETAEWLYRRAAAINPLNPAMWHDLALIYLERGDYPNAQKSLQRLLEMDPENVAARLNLGNLYFVAGEYERAERQYRRIISIDPENARAWYNLAVLMRRKGREELARGYCEKALRIREDFEKARSMCGPGSKSRHEGVP